MIHFRIALRVGLNEFSTKQSSDCESPGDSDAAPESRSVSPQILSVNTNGSIHGWGSFLPVRRSLGACCPSRFRNSLGGARLLTSRICCEIPAREDARPTEFRFGQHAPRRRRTRQSGFNILLACRAVAARRIRWVVRLRSSSFAATAFAP